MTNLWGGDKFVLMHTVEVHTVDILVQALDVLVQALQPVDELLCEGLAGFGPEKTA